MTPARPRRPVEFPSGEEWTEIVGYPRYLISTRGRVYSTISHKIMAPFWTAHGHAPAGGSWAVQVYRQRRGTTVSLAWHMLMAFTGDPPRDHVPGFRDGDRRNAVLDNLFWTPRHRPEVTVEHMAALAKRGFAASPAAQANAGRVANLRRGP